MAEEDRLPVRDLFERRVRRLLFDDGARLDEAERAAHDDGEERVRASVRLDDTPVELLQADVAAFALVLERGPVHVRERQREIVRHGLHFAGASDLPRAPVEDDDLAVEPFAGADARVAVGEQLAHRGGAFQQTWYEQRERAVLVQHVRAVLVDRLDRFALQFAHDSVI